MIFQGKRFNNVYGFGIYLTLLGPSLTDPVCLNKYMITIRFWDRSLVLGFGPTFKAIRPWIESWKVRGSEVERVKEKGTWEV